jgi:hypothetical protein
VDEGGDQDGGGERDERVPAPVQERPVLVEPQAGEHEARERGDPGDVEQHRNRPTPPVPQSLHSAGGLTAARQTAARRGHPHEGQRGPDEESRRAGVGPVVEPGGVEVRVVEDRHEHGGRRRAREQEEDQAPPPVAQRPDAHPEGEQRRPQHVELLLDGERPQVQEERGAADGLEVGLLAGQKVPVGRVAEGGDGVVAQPGDLARQEHDGERERDDEQQVQRGRRRRARRIQNAFRSIRPRSRISASRRAVIRYPLTTKKTSTPRKPPGIQASPAWYSSTATTANARSPSRPGMYGRRIPPAALPAPDVPTLRFMSLPWLNTPRRDVSGSTSASPLTSS